MSLTDRINRQQERRSTDVQPLLERRQPEWVRRAQERRLPNSDKTGAVAA